jgi:hypothetical protein
MAIDRARALFLVGFLAASGCVITTDDDDDNTGDAGAPGEGGNSVVGGRAATGGESTSGGTIGDSAGAGGAGATDEPGTAGDGGALTTGGGSSGAAGGPAAGGAAAGGAADGGTSTSEAGAGGALGGEAGSPGADGGAGSEPICDDSEGELGGCELIELDPSCEGLADFQRGQCEGAAINFKPRIAEAVQGCIKGQTPLELCDAGLTYICTDAAIRTACVDDDAALDSCAEILTGCEDQNEPVELEACLTYLSALTPAGKAEMTTCMAEWCDLYTCAEGL